MRTLYPTQIGTIESGSYQTEPSQLFFGRNVSTPNTSAKDVGFGAAGRPDFIEKMNIFLTKNPATNKLENGELEPIGNFILSSTGLAAIKTLRPRAPNVFVFELKEVDVCENGTPKKMMILASQTYLTGVA